MLVKELYIRGEEGRKESRVLGTEMRKSCHWWKHAEQLQPQHAVSCTEVQHHAHPEVQHNHFIIQATKPLRDLLHRQIYH